MRGFFIGIFMSTQQIKSVSKVLSPSWLVTAEKQQPILTDYSIVIEQDKILDILPTIEVHSVYQADQVVELPGQLIMPGMVNAHSHVSMSLMRGYADDLPLMTWLNDYIWPAERAVLSEAYVKDASLFGCAEMLQSGITTFNDMYFFPEATATAVKQSGIRANLGLVVIEFPSSYAEDAEAYLNKGFAAHDSWRDETRITTSIAPHAPYTVSNDTFEKVLTYSDQLDLTIHTHLHETVDEINESISAFGVRPIQRLDDLGVLSPQLIAAHAVHVTDSEIELLTNYGCHISHCPASNAKLGSGIAPVAQLHQHGVNICIGSDGVASNNRTDLFAEMRLAAMLCKGINQDAAILNAQALIEMVTINGAKALGLNETIGSITIGKQADLIAVNVSDLSIAPCYDPISHLVYACGREHVTHTWVDGELRYNDGCFSDIEPSELQSIIQRWQPEIQSLKQR